MSSLEIRVPFSRTVSSYRLMTLLAGLATFFAYRALQVPLSKEVDDDRT